MKIAPKINVINADISFGERYIWSLDPVFYTMLQPDLPERFDLDELCDRLSDSVLPEILPVDELVAGHAAVSARKGALAIRPPDGPSEDLAISKMLSLFSARLAARYPQCFESLQLSVIERSRAVESMPDGRMAHSAIVELRSRNGRSVIGNAEKLYELERGPALLWVRDTPDRGLELRALFSRGAFQEELEATARRAGTLLDTPDARPMLADQMLKIARRSVIPLSGMEMEPTKLTVSGDSSFATIQIDTDSPAKITCQIMLDSVTFGISYRYVMKF